MEYTDAGSTAKTCGHSCISDAPSTTAADGWNSTDTTPSEAFSLRTKDSGSGTYRGMAQGQASRSAREKKKK